MLVHPLFLYIKSQQPITPDAQPFSINLATIPGFSSRIIWVSRPCHALILLHPASLAFYGL